MDIRESYLAMIRAMPGGWGGMCGALAMTRDALENRIYERKGQGLLVETALNIQSFSGTAHFAEAVATASGGVFVQLPTDLSDDNVVLERKFHELYKELGLLSADYSQATGDDLVTPAERRLLEGDVARIQKVLSELLALTVRVYCVPDSEVDK